MVKRKSAIKSPLKKTQQQKTQTKAGQQQTQIVNVYSGGHIAKRRTKPKKKALAQSKATKAIIPAYNPPSIVNFPVGFNASNQPNVFQPLTAPPPQRQYAVFAEGENSRLLNTTPTIPVPFTFVGATEKLKAPPKEERLVPIEGGEVKAEEEEPTEAEIALATAQSLAEAEAAAIEGEPPATAEEEAAIARGFAEASKTNLAVPFTSASSASSLASVGEASALLEPRPVENPFNLPVKKGGVASAEEESLASFTSGGGDLSLPQNRFLGGPTFLFSPPLKAESEESRTSFPPLTSSGLTLPPIAPSKTPFFGEKSEEKVKRGPGRPVGSANKPKPTESIALTTFFPIEANVNPLSIPLQTAQKVEERLGFSAPLSALTTGQYEFLGGTKQPEQKAKGEGLERKRAGVLSAAEEAIIGAPPAFLNAPVSFLG